MSEKSKKEELQKKLNELQCEVLKVEAKLADFPPTVRIEGPDREDEYEVFVNGAVLEVDSDTYYRKSALMGLAVAILDRFDKGVSSE